MRSSKSRSLDGPSKRKILITLGLILIVLTSFFGGYFTQYALRGTGEKVVSDVMHIMDQVGYVYDKETDTYVKIEGNKIAQIIAGNFLDGYSAYYTKEEYEEILKNNKGEYSGFGVSMTKENSTSQAQNTNVLYGVACNSPAYQAGLKKNDKIIKAQIEGQEEVTISNGKQLNEFFDISSKDQNVTFTIERQGLAQPIEITTSKQDYTVCYVTYQDSENFVYFKQDYDKKVVSVDNVLEYINVTANPMQSVFDPDKNQPTDMGDDVALITLSAFEGDAAYQLGAAIKYMLSVGRTKLILDLCDNGGGSMSVLKDVATYLIYNYNNGNNRIAIATDKLDATTQEEFMAQGARTTYYTAYGRNFDTRIEEITVMANSNTASASECLIGAMIWYGERPVPDGKEKNLERFDRSKLVVIDDDGDGVYATYGKGIMQTTYKLSSGGAIKLTTAKLVWPDERTCIHRVGIKPIDQEGIQYVDNMQNTYQDGLNRAVAILTDGILPPVE